MWPFLHSKESFILFSALCAEFCHVRHQDLKPWFHFAHQVTLSYLFIIRLLKSLVEKYLFYKAYSWVLLFEPIWNASSLRYVKPITFIYVMHVLDLKFCFVFPFNIYYLLLYGLFSLSLSLSLLNVLGFVWISSGI